MTRLVQLYRGDFLSGLNLKGSPAYDEWRLLLQERYHRQILAALDTLCAHHSALGHYEQENNTPGGKLNWNPGARKATNK